MVGSLSEISRHSKLHISISIVTMLNGFNRNLAGYAQTKAICNALFDVCKRAFLEIGPC